MNEAIGFYDVSFSYDISPVLENVNFVINRGDFISIVGPNGGGKTTIAKLILGLYAPTKGKILVNGDSSVRMRDRIGYVPQYSNFDPNFPVSVIDVVLMGRLKNFSIRYSRTDRQEAIKALEHVGLEDQGTKPYSTLSGGQRQRALIARALTSNPEILLLDEPTSNVDAEVEYKMSALLNNLKQKMTVLLISHDLGFVSELVDKVICVNKEVDIHPARGITREHIEELYQENVKIVRHDIRVKT